MSIIVLLSPRFFLLPAFSFVPVNFHDPQYRLFITRCSKLDLSVQPPASSLRNSSLLGVPAGRCPVAVPAKVPATASGLCATAIWNFQSSTASVRRFRCAELPARHGARIPAGNPAATVQWPAQNELGRWNGYAPA